MSASARRGRRRHALTAAASGGREAGTGLEAAATTCLATPFASAGGLASFSRRSSSAI